MAAKPLATILKNIPQASQKPILYFYGEETFLIEECLRRLSQEITGQDILSAADCFNADLIYADEREVGEVLDLAGTLPFGAKRRLVVVKRADKWSTKNLEKLLPYLENPLAETCLIFWGGQKVDGRKKFFKGFDKKGLLIVSDRLKGGELQAWIGQFAKRRGHAIEPAAAAGLENLIGSSLYAQEQAVERLSLFLGEGEKITTKDLHRVLADTREGIVWSLTDALGKGDTQAAFLALKRLLRQKDASAPILIVGALAGFYRRLLLIQMAEQLGLSDGALQKTARLSPGALYMNRPLARRFSTLKTRRALGILSQTDRKLKSTGLGPPLILSEMVLELSHL